MIKSDNIESIGQHCFERAGLGVAPFRFVGFEVRTYQACPGAPIQPGAACDYCGQGIMNCCTIRDANGKKFVVGCDCVNRTGEAGIIKAYKTSKAYRAHQKTLRDAKADRQRDELVQLLTEKRAEIAAHPHPYGFTDRKTGVALTLLDWADWMATCSGAKGRAGTLKTIKAALG